VSLTTVPVHIETAHPLLGGAGLAYGRVRASRTSVDAIGAIIAVLSTEDFKLDANGIADVQWTPDTLGANGTKTKILLIDRADNIVGEAMAVIPNSPCNLAECLQLVPATKVDDATRASLAAQGYAAQSYANALVSQSAANTAVAAANMATAVLADANFVAVSGNLPQIDVVGSISGNVSTVSLIAGNVSAVAANAGNINAVAGDLTNIDFVGGNISAVNAAAANMPAIQAAPTYAAGAAASDADATQQAANANSFALSAAAQAAQAYAWSLSAASAQQQDLSLVSKQMHFSPNAILGTLFYDTGKDSNPAWVDQVQNASYMFETLNGTWLVPTSPDGWQSELDARSSGATLGAEVSPDPTFASSAGWTLGSGASIASNTLTAASVATGVGIASRADAVGGSMALATAYQCTVVVGALTAGAITVRLGNTTSVLRTLKTPGTYVFTVNPGAAGAALGLYASGTTSGTVTKFSIKPVTANTTATGSYFQNATDGKHYSLNAGAGVTQTTNGNSNKPPRVMAIVWEAGYLCIYDPTKLGCPLWKSFLCTVATSAIGAITVATLVGNGVWAKEGKLWIGNNTGALMVDFANDKMLLGRAGFVYTLTDRRIAARNAQPAGAVIAGLNGIDGYNLGSNTTNCIAGCVYSDAPVDPNTGLLQPTIFIGSNTPCTLIKDDGSAPITTTSMGSVGAAAITPWYLLAGLVTGASFSITLGSLRGVSANWAVTTLAANANQFTASGDNNSGLLACSRSLVAKLYAGSTAALPVLDLMRFNASNPLASLFARITPYSNTGWMVGDIRGCWLSDILSGSAIGTEQVTNGTFPTDVSGWTSTANMVWLAGQMQVTVTGGGSQNRASQALNLTPGKTYAINGSMQAAAGNAINNSASIRVNINGNYVFAQPVTAKGVTQNVVNQQFTVPYGTLTTCQVELLVASNSQFGNVGDSATFDNISVVEVGADRSLKANPLFITGSLTRAAANTATQIMLWAGWSAANYAQQAYSANMDPGTGGVTASIWGTIPSNVAAAGTAVDRSFSSGAYYTFGHDATGKLTATVFDGTTTRTVTTAASYATGQLFKARMIFSPSGTLSISVNGAVVASTTGAPLGSLSNASAVLTVGQNRALTQPWSGGLALVRIGMTLPTQEQSALCYEQEYMMFQPGAVCALADATSLQGFDYDASQQKLKVVSSGFENSLIGLTFAAQAAVSQGSFTGCAHTGGMKMLARSTTNPGVDIMVPAYALREELANRDRAAAERARLTQCLDFTGGFTASTTNGGTALTSVAGWTYPSQTNPRGEVATGSGIPASTSITDVVGTTAYLSAPATAGASGVQIALTDFALPVGYEAIDVFAAGSLKVEGATNDYTRLFDGFRETIRFPAGAPPGYSAKVHINARRYAQ
jgi:hypothetical protein